jgi:hypothetical protein
MQHPLPAKVGTNFADKWRSLGWYSSLADYSHVFFFLSHQHLWITGTKLTWISCLAKVLFQADSSSKELYKLFEQNIENHSENIKA